MVVKLLKKPIKSPRYCSFPNLSKFLGKLKLGKRSLNVRMLVLSWSIRNSIDSLSLTARLRASKRPCKKVPSGRSIRSLRPLRLLITPYMRPSMERVVSRFLRKKGLVVRSLAKAMMSRMAILAPSNLVSSRTALGKSAKSSKESNFNCKVSPIFELGVMSAMPLRVISCELTMASFAASLLSSNPLFSRKEMLFKLPENTSFLIAKFLILMSISRTSMCA